MATTLLYLIVNLTALYAGYCYGHQQGKRIGWKLAKRLPMVFRLFD